MDRLAEEACSIAATKGFLFSKRGDFTFSLFPFTMFPSPMPESQFQQGYCLGVILNKLCMSVSTDLEFLRKSLAHTVEADKQFTGRLMSILQASPRTYPIQLSINRYDFFTNASADLNATNEKRGLKLVEINTMGAGGIDKSRIMTELHSSIHTHPAATAIDKTVDTCDIPKNKCDANVAMAFSKAHTAFVDKYNISNARLVMVVLPPYQVRCDHTLLRQRFLCDHNIDFLRMTLADIEEHGEVDANGHLQIRNFAGIDLFTVSIAYFRTGYNPNDYPTEKQWKGRAMIEKSTAISCPSIGMQLTGFKKIQQVLGEDGMLEKYLTADEASMVKDTLVKQWDFSDDNARTLALNDPDAYVLKPQRESGGNNLYNEEIRTAAKTMSPSKRAGYTLMQRIHPCSNMNVIVKDGSWKDVEMVSEIGFFGSIVSVDNEAVYSNTSGHYMKSKPATENEGSFGIDAADSPLLQYGK